MKFEKIIYETNEIRLLVNFDGLSDNIAKATEIQLKVFAFSKLTFKEIFNETLNIESIRKLYSHLDSISILKDSLLGESWKFIEFTTKSLVDFITSVEKIDDWVVSLVLWKISTKDMLDSLSSLDLDNLSAGHKQQQYKLELKKLQLILYFEDKWNLLDMVLVHPLIKEYWAKQQEKILQNWLENNLWVFWTEYSKMEKFRTISELSEADLVMESIDWYLDLIELKRSKYDLLVYDRSHKCYHWRKNLNSVIWQSMHYIKWLQEFAKTLEKKHRVKVLRPRVKIVAGRSNKFNEQEFDTLRMINSHLVDISIITYDEILKYWEKIISHYE